jgi:sugar lactone lactonase YvrE/pimeloyl-ACP methyl ester carboxylesterase
MAKLRMKPLGMCWATLLAALPVAGQPYLLFTTYSGNSVLRYSITTGAFVDTFVSPGSGGLFGAEGLTFGPDGNLYIVSTGNNSILRYNGSTGAFIDVFVASGSGGLSEPYRPTFGPDGNLYISSLTNSEVLQFNGSTGAFMSVFVNSGSGGIYRPDGLTFGPDGNLYVCAYWNHKIARYNGATGAYMGDFVLPNSGGLSGPDVAVFRQDGYLYVNDEDNSTVLRFNATTGAFVGVFVSAGSGGLSHPQSIAFGPDGKLYVTSFFTNQVKRYDATTGAFIDTFATASGGGADPIDFAFTGGGPATGPWPQVLIVPGIFGTKLANTSEIVWLSNATIDAGANPFSSPFNDLSYNTDGTPASTLTTTAVTRNGDFGGLFNLSSETGTAAYALDCNTNLAKLAQAFGANCAKNVYVYNSLHDTLSANFAVDTFSYDWRREIGSLSDDLYVKVRAMYSARAGTPVALIAHSMGGLIVQEMLYRYGATVTSMLGPIITLGTPFLGSLDTYLYFQGWQDLIPNILPGSVMAQLGANWPSAYELLPRWDFFQLAGQTIPYSQVYSGQTLPSWAGGLPRQAALPTAYNLWAEPPLTAYPNAYAIVGSGYATAYLITDDGQTDCARLLAANGDKSVPLASARAGSWIPPGHLWYVNEEHVGLPSNSSVIRAISVILQGGTPSNLLGSPTSANWQTINECSPVLVSASNSQGEVEGPTSNQISGGQYFNLTGHSQVWVPDGDTYTVKLTGTGTGTFTSVWREVDQDGNTLQQTSFNQVPVKPTSVGTIQVSSRGATTLSYDYIGNGVLDTIPANIVPPTIYCSGGYFSLQGVRASFSFNIGYMGAVSTFAYNYRNSTQTVQFISTTTTQVSVLSKTAHFSGQGTLNGKAGYSFSVTTTDGGSAGSGLDSVSISITGPNNYSYTAGSSISGGDIIVSQ